MSPSTHSPTAIFSGETGSISATSAVDPESGHAYKTAESHRDGYKAHLAAEPDTGLVTDAELTPDNNRRRGGGRPGRLLFVVIRGPCVWWPSEPMRVRAAASIRAGEHGGN